MRWAIAAISSARIPSNREHRDIPAQPPPARCAADWARRKGLAVGQPGKRVGDSAVMQLALKQPYLLNRNASDTVPPSMLAVMIDPSGAAERVPALALRFAAGIGVGTGDHQESAHAVRTPFEYAR